MHYAERSFKIFPTERKICQVKECVRVLRLLFLVVSFFFLVFSLFLLLRPVLFLCDFANSHSFFVVLLLLFL